MNGEVETLIKMKNWLYQRQRRSGNLDYNTLNANTKDISNAVNFSKFRYHNRPARNLNDPNDSKIPVIPPLSVGNRLVTDYLAKANFLMMHFVNNTTQEPTTAIFQQI